ncbi:MAG TPA: Mov34/MPN/PAD-1 family protein, partial [Chthonomonadales bacterium]|nr:Mov34/MPN/PAD-1 family protein [Chthonomonadales bacterium]
MAHPFAITGAPVGVLALLLSYGAFLSGRRSVAKPEGSEEDLLQAAEEAAFRKAREALRAGEQRSPANNAREADPETDRSGAILWVESEKVFQPRQVSAARFLSEIGLNANLAPRKYGLGIFVRQRACDTLWSHVTGDLEIERAGLLIGKVALDPARSAYLLLVEEALTACEADATAVSVEYTPDSWRAITPRLASIPADWTILGSYHSHPGMGLFLSPVDKETQREIFPHDWQVAVVVDPVTQRLACFTGADDRAAATWTVIEGARNKPPGKRRSAG